MAVICLDTNILVAGIQQQSSEPSFNKNAAALLGSLGKSNQHVLLIPSIVVAEFMVGVPNEDKDFVFERLSQYTIGSFDARAARLYGSLFDGELKADRPRSAIMADKMIIATALVYKADFAYSHDSGFRNIAERCKFRAIDVPPAPPTQISLFEQ